MSAALLSSPILRSATAGGAVADVFVESATSIKSILLSLLLSRSGNIDSLEASIYLMQMHMIPRKYKVKTCIMRSSLLATFPF